MLRGHLTTQHFQRSPENCSEDGQGFAGCSSAWRQKTLVISEIDSRDNGENELTEAPEGLYLKLVSADVA